MKTYEVVIVTRESDEPHSSTHEVIASTPNPAELAKIVAALMKPAEHVKPAANPFFNRIHAPGRPGEKVIVSPLGKTDVAGFAPGTEFVSATHATKELRSRGLIAEAKYNYVYLKLKEAVTKKDPAERLAFVEGIAFQYERDAVAAVTRD